jgi:hypothetical protein
VGSYLATSPLVNESEATSEETPKSHGDPASNGNGHIETAAEPSTASGEPAR